MNRVEKPWGFELHWAKTDKYVGKLIHVNAGHALSLQYHNRKDETIFLWSGKMLFEIKEGDQLVKREMKPGEAVHITPPTVHRMTAIEDCDIFEVSTSSGWRIAMGGSPRSNRANGARLDGTGDCGFFVRSSARIQLTRESRPIRMAGLLKNVTWSSSGLLNQPPQKGFSRWAA
jgi:mannose-6-phosphate isomerase-like protein (cupin superfamily)